MQLHLLKVAGDTLGSLVCTYLKRMHQEQRLISTGLSDICWLHTIRYLHNSHNAPYRPLALRGHVTNASFKQ